MTMTSSDSSLLQRNQPQRRLTKEKDVLDSERKSYKDVLEELEKQCGSFKSYAISNGVISFVATGIIDGFFRIEGFKIALHTLLKATAKFLTTTVATAAACAMTAGIAVLISFVIDLVKCFCKWRRRDYSPLNKELNNKLCLKELKDIIAASIISSVVTFCISLVVC